jgi:hypothetical protein
MTSRGRIQAVVVVGLAAGLLNATAATMNRAVNTLEIVSYSLIVLIGLRLLWVKGRAFIAALHSLHRPAAVGAAVTPVHHDDSYHDETQHGHRVQAHHGHDHSREPHTLDCSCGHAHHHDHDYHASAWGHAHREPTWSFLAQIPHTKTKPEPRNGAGPCHFEPLVESGWAAGFEPLHQESCPIGPAAIVPREVRWQIVRRTPAGPTAGYQLLMQRFE